jgi:hypothetical protein
VWQEQDDVSAHTSNPLNPGDVTEVEDNEGSLVGNSVILCRKQMLAAPTYPVWPAEIELICVPGARVKISLQSSLLRAIFKAAFENVRVDLLLNDAFPNTVTMPNMIRKCLVDAARDCTTRGGQYNESAASVHQRLLSDVEYEGKMAQLVSGTI